MFYLIFRLEKEPRFVDKSFSPRQKVKEFVVDTKNREISLLITVIVGQIPEPWEKTRATANNENKNAPKTLAERRNFRNP